MYAQRSFAFIFDIFQSMLGLIFLFLTWWKITGVI